MNFFSETEEIEEKEEEIAYFDQFTFIIEELYWERVFLHFTISTDYPGTPLFALKSRTTKQLVPLKYTRDEQGRYLFCVNITAANIRDFLDNGRWIIAFRLPDETTLPGEFKNGPQEHNFYHGCFITTELAYKLENLTRVFRYGGNKFAYTINFVVYSRDDIHLTLMINNYFMEKNTKWQKRRYVHEANTKKTRRRKVWYTFVIKGMNAFYKVASLFRKKNGKNLMIMAETIETISGNLKAIDDRLKERGLDKELNITYSFRRAVGTHMSIWSWVVLVCKISRQNIIIVDNYVPIFSFLKLKDDVEFIQVWHAGGGFKAVGYCRFGKNGSPFPVGSCHKAYTTALTGSTQLIPVFEEVFGIEKEAFFPVGMPRLDGYLDPQKINSFRENFYAEYPYLKDKKIILFAPTYRGVGQKTANYKQSNIDLAQIYDVCGDEFVFLVKLHPFIQARFEIEDYMKDRIYDFSDFPSINDLFYVTDVLITDYSSNFYEFSLMRKPMLFYTYDRCIYELTRGVYRGVKESAPGKVCDSFEELIEALRNKDYEYEKVAKFVSENFDDIEGSATDKLIDEVILKKINNKNN